MIYAILAAALVAVDQLVKYLVMTNIPLGEHVPFIPYILELTYVTNTGAAFSMFSEHTWALALVSLVMSAVLALALWKGLFKHPLGKMTLTLRQAVSGPAAGGGGGQPDRPGLPGFCGGHVQRAVHALRRVQCGGHLRGGGGHRRRNLLSVPDGQAGTPGGDP